MLQLIRGNLWLGNWSTDIAGGSAYGYSLLFVILLSSIIAMFLQMLALKVGLVTNRDLAQVCRDAYPQYVSNSLWVVMEVAICATDLAEVQYVFFDSSI